MFVTAIPNWRAGEEFMLSNGSEFRILDLNTDMTATSTKELDSRGTVSRANLHGGIWPYKLVACDAAGNQLSAQVIPTDVPATPAAQKAHIATPQPLPACR